MIKLTFHGAAQTTTGSMHLLEINDARILLDCGLMQGKRKEAFERNRNLPFDPASIDKVLLSHAHIDHSGNIPTLVRNGFRGDILATPATIDLCDIMLRDSAYLQVKDVEYVNKKRARQGKNLFEPLYSLDDIDPTMERFKPAPYEQDIEILPGVIATFHDAGHLLGSALISIHFLERKKRLLFTGDLGRNDMLILRDPTVVHDIDWLITECTYGNRLHPPKPDVQDELKTLVKDIHARRSRLVIPAFSVGRTQNVVYHLREIYESDGIPHVPVYVDSPLSTRATGVYKKHKECYDHDALQVLFDGEEPFQFRNLTYVENVNASKKLNDLDGPLIIISASGMCEGGRILHHLARAIEDPDNAVLIVGYQAENTLGRRIVERAETVKIFGEQYDLRARVHVINALSAHADRSELLAYFNKMGSRVERAFCVHGEPEPTAAIAKALAEAGVADVIAPERGRTVEL